MLGDEMVGVSFRSAFYLVVVVLLLLRERASYGLIRGWGPYRMGCWKFSGRSLLPEDVLKCVHSED